MVQECALRACKASLRPAAEGHQGPPKTSPIDEEADDHDHNLHIGTEGGYDFVHTEGQTEEVDLRRVDLPNT